MIEIETPKASTSKPVSSHAGRQALGLGLMALTAIAAGLLAVRWATAFQGKELWLAGMVLALGLAPAMQLLCTWRNTSWFCNLSLEALAVTLFASGISPGGAFWMWTLGSLVAIIPLALWALEPATDHDPEWAAQDDAPDEAPAIQLAAAA